MGLEDPLLSSGGRMGFEGLPTPLYRNKREVCSMVSAGPLTVWPTVSSDTKIS